MAKTNKITAPGAATRRSFHFHRRRRDLSGGGFADTVVRHALFAVFKTAETEGTRDSITWLKTEVKEYAANRQGLIETLEFLAALRQVTTMQHWHKDAEAAGVLAGALRNRQDNV